MTPSGTSGVISQEGLVKSSGREQFASWVRKLGYVPITRAGNRIGGRGIEHFEITAAGLKS